jgi:hypothetical protein
MQRNQIKLRCKFGVYYCKIFKVDEPCIRIKGPTTKETQQNVIESLILLVILQNIDELCEELSNFVGILLE